MAYWGLLKSLSYPNGTVASIPIPPSKRVLEAVQSLSPAVIRSAGMKVWPRPPGIGLRMSVCGLTRVVRHHMTSSMS